jgi:metal-responsive CopG/Arc/MetJ family transcriptional regulator
MTQVKFVINDELLKKFKQIVIKRRGKIELTPEGEEAIRLYVKKYEDLERKQAGTDPLVRAISAVRTGKARSALRDLKELESHH